MQQCGRAAAGAALRDLLQSSLAHIAHDTGPAQCLRHVRTAAAPSIGSLTPARFDHESWAWQPHVWRPHRSSCQRRNRRIATQPENDVAARTSCNSKVADETTGLQEYAVVKLYRGPHIRAVAFFMRCAPADTSQRGGCHQRSVACLNEEQRRAQLCGLARSGFAALVDIKPTNAAASTPPAGVQGEGCAARGHGCCRISAAATRAR